MWANFNILFFVFAAKLNKYSGDMKYFMKYVNENEEEASIFIYFFIFCSLENVLCEVKSVDLVNSDYWNQSGHSSFL